MIRVLHVIGAMDRGGAETLIMNLYRAINRSCVQFDFLVHEDRECDYDAEIRELGGHIYRLPRFTGANFFSYRKKCREHFEKHTEHVVVHGHIGSSASIYLSEAKRAGRYAIAHSHAQNFETGLPALGFRLVSFPTRFIADCFLGCSREAGIDRFGKKVVEGKNFTVLRNGIDTSSYAFDDSIREKMRHELGIGLEAPVFGHVGRLIEVKNHAFLLDVFLLVKHDLPDAVLLLAGRGELEPVLRENVINKGLEDSVLFLGVRNDVPDVMQAMDVFVFPSRKEGLPVAAIEAQASGLPTLLSCGVPELAIASSFARRIALEDGVEKWAKGCLEAYRESQAFSRSDAVREVVDHGFDIDSAARWLEQLYSEKAEASDM